MFRSSSNNPFIQGGYLNAAYSETLGGPETVGQRYPGLLGQTVVASNWQALKVSDTVNVGTLYMGVYQLVKFGSAIVRGNLVFWDTLANNGLNDFEVVGTVSATTVFRAGVALRTDASATGKYGWIQVAGLATMHFQDAVTSNVIGDLIIQSSLTTATVDSIADAGTTFATNGGAKLFVGTAYELPADLAGGALTRVLMNTFGFYANIAGR